MSRVPTKARSAVSRVPGRRRVAFALLYALGVLLFVEAAARGILAVGSISQGAALRSSAGWRLQWLERHRPEAPIYYGFDVFHPTRGWSSRPGVRGADTFGPDSVNINSAGLRGAREVVLAQEPGRRRVAVLGDSFTFGDEVRDEEAYPSVLDGLLPKAEVINFGVHGYGHDQMLLLLREQALAYRPDLVVVGFVRDDMERNLLAFRDFAKPRFVLTGDRLSLRNVPVPTPDEIRRRTRWRPRFFDLLAVLRDSYLWKVGIKKQRMEALTAALLDAMVEDSVEVGAVVVFVYLPHSEELTDPTLETEGYTFFTDYCKERAAFCLDLLPRFREAVAAGVEIKAPGHWHGTGHRIVARSVGEYIRARDLLHL